MKMRKQTTEERFDAGAAFLVLMALATLAVGAAVVLA